jgi:hypothetical protein
MKKDSGDAARELGDELGGPLWLTEHDQVRLPAISSARVGDDCGEPVCVFDWEELVVGAFAPEFHA